MFIRDTFLLTLTIDGDDFSLRRLSRIQCEWRRKGCQNKLPESFLACPFPDYIFDQKISTSTFYVFWAREQFSFVPHESSKNDL